MASRCFVKASLLGKSSAAFSTRKSYSKVPVQVFY